MCGDFGIADKIYKIVCDQARNVKKAFGQVEEGDDEVQVALNLIQRQRNIDNEAEKKKKEAQQQAKLVEQVNREIDAINITTNNRDAPLKRAHQVLEDYDLDEITEELSDSDDESNATLDDSTDDFGPTPDHYDQYIHEHENTPSKCCFYWIFAILIGI